MTLIKYCPVCKEPVENQKREPKKFKYHDHWYKCGNCKYAFVIMHFSQAMKKRLDRESKVIA